MIPTTPIFNDPNMIYWAVILILVIATTTTLGELWKRQENLRWTTGYALVFLTGSIMVRLGFWDLNTWAGLFFATGICGIVKVGYEHVRASWEARKIRRGGSNGTTAAR